MANVRIFNESEKDLDITTKYDGAEIWISVKEKNETGKVLLDSLKDGDMFCDHRGITYIVCEHFDHGVGVCKADFVTRQYRFGDTNDYRCSQWRHYLNHGYYDEIEEIFGGSINILPHEVDLLSMDGYDSYGILPLEFVSPLTYDRYRKYHKYIGNRNCAYLVQFLTTPYSTDEGCGDNLITYVDSQGMLRTEESDWKGVWCTRPFFVLKSDIEVQKI